MNHKRYLVLGGPNGKRRYRDHDPGDTFVARLDPDAERRAVERGSIRVLEVVSPELENGSYVLPPDWSLLGSYALPKDWPHEAADARTTRAAAGVSQGNEGG